MKLLTLYLKVKISHNAEHKYEYGNTLILELYFWAGPEHIYLVQGQMRKVRPRDGDN